MIAEAVGKVTLISGVLVWAKAFVSVYLQTAIGIRALVSNIVYKVFKEKALYM